MQIRKSKRRIQSIATAPKPRIFSKNKRSHSNFTKKEVWMCSNWIKKLQHARKAVEFEL